MTHHIRTGPPSPDLSGPLRALPWADQAVCATTDPELWFPDKGAVGYVTADGTREHRAKAICRRCPVLEECREYAIEAAEPYGIWGGLSADERRALRRERGAA
jgi:WhiB family redox-sensing transcriptional regulator